MASAKLAPILTDLIGSIGPDTFSHTRAVLIVKGKSYPGSAHPFTPSASQLYIQGLFKIAALHWKELDPLVIIDWCDLAKTLPAYNKFGESYYQAGFNLYCKVQQYMQLISLPIYNPAPSVPVIYPLSSFSLDFNPSSNFSYNINFPGQQTDAQCEHLIFSTPPVSPGRFYVRTFYRLIGIIPHDTVDTFDSLAQYLAVFSTPTSISKIFCKLLPVDNQTGFTASPLIESAPCDS